MGFLRKDKKKNEETENDKGAKQEKKTERAAQRRVLCVVIVLILIALCAAGIFYYFYFCRGIRPVLGNTVFNAVEEEKEIDRNSRDSIAQNGGMQDNVENLTIKTAEQDGEEQSTTQKTAKETAELLQKETDEEVLLQIKEPVLEGETICGADGPILDYADESRIIFHGYYGLFVYDREWKRITGAVDLEEIGCQYTQGDFYCDTAVDMSGETVYLHPISADDVYIYYVEKQILTRKQYADTLLSHRYQTGQTQEYVEPDVTVWRSEQCALLAEDTCLYLETGSGLAEDLFYVVEQDGERQTYEHLLDSYLSEKDTAKAGADIEDFGKASAGEESGLEEETTFAGREENALAAGMDSDWAQAAQEEANKEIDIQAYSEEEFRNLCVEVDYRKLLREQDACLNGAISVDLTVLGQIDGGLFDDNIYYICTAEDKKGYTRYYVIRDDRTEDAMLIMEGDVVRIYGQFFDTCECPAEFLKTRTEIPALTMAYCDLLEE